MLLHYLFCLAFLASVVVIDADSSLTAPKSTFRSAPQHVYSKEGTLQATNDITFPRLLRANKASDLEHTEDRTGGISVSFIESLKSAFMSSKITTEKLEKWTEKGKSADTAFKRFHLDKPG
ncbi:RxLR effector protein, partial [Phytophthora megakarya]